MKKISIAFFGSSDFSADFLEKLITDKSINRLVMVKFVVTQPDRPVGRKQILTPTPVKTIAQKYGIEILEIENLKLNENCKLKIENCDLCLLYAYAGIIPPELLTLPKYGFWCLHPSLLPKYRGTSPMATALINGDRETGMTIIKMDEEIDHGPIIAQEKYRILPEDKRPDLEKKLTDLGFEMFKKLFSKMYGQGIALSLQMIPQNHSHATYTKKLTKQDGFIEFKNSKLKIYNLYRGLYPWPGIWTILPNGKRLKIISLKLSNLKTLELVSVQLEGKKEVDFKTFIRAFPLAEFLD